MMLGRTVPACMAAIILISLLSITGTLPARASDGSFGGGDGSADDPYIIEDVQDLQNMSGDRSAHYVLGNDINASVTRD